VISVCETHVPEGVQAEITLDKQAGTSHVPVPTVAVPPVALEPEPPLVVVPPIALDEAGSVLEAPPLLAPPAPAPPVDAAVVLSVLLQPKAKMKAENPETNARLRMRIPLQSFCVRANSAAVSHELLRK